jgi:hypothetical protein
MKSYGATTSVINLSFVSNIFFPVSLNDLKFYMFYMLAINIQMSLSIVRQKQFQIKWEKSLFM